MRAHSDPDLLLVESMLTPSLDDARSSLDYWERRRKALPLHRRGARREAREMAARWDERVRVAQQARFDASPVGRLFAAVGISSAWIRQLSFNKRWFFALAWAFVPPQVKLVAGAVLATWLLVVLAALSVFLAILVQLT